MMIRHPLGLRLDSKGPLRDQIYEAARLGARGVVLDAIGDLAPHRLSETGRRDLRHVLRTVELSLVAIALPTRRPFDTTDQLDDRIRRADAAFAMAYELGTSLVLARAGALPPAEDPARREPFTNALRELGDRAEHRGVRLALEAGSEPGKDLNEFLVALDCPGLAVSIDPAVSLAADIDPVACVRELAAWVAHAYANDATGSAGISRLNPRGFGYPAGALDWEEYLGALEEIGYQGFLTVWPPPHHPAALEFTNVRNRLAQFS
jgi:sugar phosphate isomerase/epimerase